MFYFFLHSQRNYNIHGQFSSVIVYNDHCQTLRPPSRETCPPRCQAGCHL
ncbi:hypothetical protein LEMLEM_LOCUS11313 [Lemmus lemmus]